MLQKTAALERYVSSRKSAIDPYLADEWEMHVLCYRASAKPRLVREIEAYRRQAERYFRLALGRYGNHVEDFNQQREFCAACASRDGDRAAAMAQELLEWTVRSVRPLLEEKVGTS